MELEQFTKERTEPKQGRNRTVNIDEGMHLFMKRTANYYNIPMSDLMHNILNAWKEKYEQKIKEQMINNM